MLFVVGVLAAPAEEDVSPGLLGFLVVLAIGLTLVFLLRSMNKRMKNIKAPREEDLRQAEWEARQRADSGKKDDDGPKG